MVLMHVDFYSQVLGRSECMDVILPEIENASPGSLKTLYLLHGMTDDHTIWQRRTSIERYADDFGIAVVMPTTKLGWYTNAAYGEAYFDFISDELIRISRRMFPLLSHRREDTFVAGLSMGGYGALKCALKQPETFCKAAAFSGGVDAAALSTLPGNPEADFCWADIFGPDADIPGSENDLFAAAEALTANRPDIFMWCGTEDFLYEMNLKMRNHLRSLGYNLTYTETEGSHLWMYWDREIQNALRWMLPGEEEKPCH